LQGERGAYPTAKSPLERSPSDAEALAKYSLRHNITGVQEAISGIAKAGEYFAARNPKGDAQRGALCGLLGFGLRDLSWDRVEREHSSSCVSETDQPTDKNTRGLIYLMQ
jgi:hypothetical protein